MNTRLGKKETMVYGNIEVMADVIGGTSTLHLLSCMISIWIISRMS